MGVISEGLIAKVRGEKFVRPPMTALSRMADNELRVDAGTTPQAALEVVPSLIPPFPYVSWSGCLRHNLGRVLLLQDVVFMHAVPRGKCLGSVGGCVGGETNDRVVGREEEARFVGKGFESPNTI